MIFRKRNIAKNIIIN